MDIRSKLFDGPRSVVLVRLARGICELTIRNRASYDQPDALHRLIEGNEAIHRLNGHLHDLIDPDEELTESRKDGILEQLRLLPPSALVRFVAR